MVDDHILFVTLNVKLDRDSLGRGVGLSHHGLDVLGLVLDPSLAPRGEMWPTSTSSARSFDEGVAWTTVIAASRGLRSSLMIV